MLRLKDLLAIAVGGGLGAVCRFSVGLWAHQLLGPHFPYGTLAVNVVGCFLLGLLAHAGSASAILPESLGLPARVGFLGALTTFSTFGYETLRLVETSQWWLALGNVLANLLLGLLAVWVGTLAARLLVGIGS